MSTLAVIPARGGSKRIPSKNIRNLLGKPVISYPLQTARESGLFAEVMVSTDDKAIAAIAKEEGASVPFMRSSLSSTDFATTVDVLLETIEQYSQKGVHFEYICCIYPVSALITAADLREAYSIIVNTKADSVVTIQRYTHPPQRGLRIGGDGNLHMICPEHAATRTQDLETIYHDAGQFYFIETEVLLEKKSLFTEKSHALILDELHSQDVDTLSDWKLLEMKFQRRALVK